MNEFVLIKVVSVLIASIFQILLKKSANKKYDSRIKEYLNIFVIVGYGLFFVSLILSVLSLKGIFLSLSSIIESLSYIVVPLFSYLFLKEKLNKSQYIGVIVIIIGIVIFNI